MKKPLEKGNTVGLIACSDGLRHDEAPTLQKIEQTLNVLGLRVKKAETLFRQNGTPFSGSPRHRAAELMRLFTDHEVRAVFDVSGGDSANQILPFLDFDQIRESGTPFVGISDLSVINNAAYARTGLTAYHYRIKNLAGPFAEEQTTYFQKFFMDDSASSLDYRWLRGNQMKGIAIGGNIRCFLKLAGTACFPDPSGKILFLEALGGGPARMASLLAQLQQLGVFSRCAGVLLGTFSTMQNEKKAPAIEELVLDITEEDNDLPVAKTEQLGHGENAKCLAIGAWLSLPSIQPSP